MVVLGPGSLFTSTIPALLGGGVREALAGFAGPVVYVANVMTQPGETGGFAVSDHVRAHSRAPRARRDRRARPRGDLPPELLARYAAEEAAPVEVDREALREHGRPGARGGSALRGRRGRGPARSRTAGEGGVRGCPRSPLRCGAQLAAGTASEPGRADRAELAGLRGRRRLLGRGRRDRPHPERRRRPLGRAPLALRVRARTHGSRPPDPDRFGRTRYAVRTEGNGAHPGRARSCGSSRASRARRGPDGLPAGRVPGRGLGDAARRPGRPPPGVRAPGRGLRPARRRLLPRAARASSGAGAGGWPTPRAPTGLPPCSPRWASTTPSSSTRPGPSSARRRRTPTASPTSTRPTPAAPPPPPPASRGRWKPSTPHGLPAALREMLELRLEHPDASLAELARLGGLSKSAANHRLQAAGRAWRRGSGGISPYAPGKQVQPEADHDRLLISRLSGTTGRTIAIDDGEKSGRKGRHKRFRSDRDADRQGGHRASDDDIEIVAVNDLMPMESLALLFKRDTVHGIWPEDVEPRR